MLYEIQGWYDGRKELEEYCQDWMMERGLGREYFYLDEFGNGHFEIEFDHYEMWAVNMMNTLEDDFPDIEVTNLS